MEFRDTEPGSSSSRPRVTKQSTRASTMRALVIKHAIEVARWASWEDMEGPVAPQIICGGRSLHKDRDGFHGWADHDRKGVSVRTLDRSVVESMTWGQIKKAVRAGS